MALQQHGVTSCCAAAPLSPVAVTCHRRPSRAEGSFCQASRACLGAAGLTPGPTAGGKVPSGSHSSWHPTPLQKAPVMLNA